MNACLELDLNEMPYPPPDSVVEAARKTLKDLNRYTEPDAPQELAELLARYSGVQREQIVVGPGSDLLLREVVMCFGAGKKVVMVSPSFLSTVRVARRFARTLDKAFGLAGARVGYLIAGSAFLEAFSMLFTFLPQASLQAALEALRQPGYMWKNVQLVMKERERLRRELQIMGTVAYPSNTNFLLLKSRMPGMAEELQERDVLVLDLLNQLGPGYIRVAVGALEENDAFIRAYRSVAQRQDEGIES